MAWTHVELIRTHNTPEADWPSGMDAVIPLEEPLLRQPSDRDNILLTGRFPDGRLCPLIWDGPAGVQAAFDVDAWITALQEERYRPVHQKPLMAQLPFHYHRIPSVIRNSVLKALVSTRAVKHGFPHSWLNGGCEIVLAFARRIWDAFDRPVCVLTHDIDTKEGFGLVADILAIERAHQMASSWNVVPKHYAVQEDVLRRVIEQGGEVGLHGIWHNNGEAFLSRDDFRREMNSLKAFRERFHITGYRSPSWFKTPDMFQAVAEFFTYDTSCLDLDLICPAGHGGVGFARPFTFQSGLTELPCTLPFEAPLFSGVAPEELCAYWKPKIDFIAARKGMLLINTHPDPNYLGLKGMLDAYGQLLRYVAQGAWEHRLPKDMAQQVKA